MAGNFYLGNASDLASNMGSMFGGQGSVSPKIMQPIRTPQQFQASGTGNQNQQIPNGQSTGSTSQPYAGPFNPLAAQAVRPTSFGNFDPSYGQNLATAIGGTFQRPQQNEPLQFNPYGNLTDANVPYPNLGGGNAPFQGLPATLLQWAQMFNPTALGTNKVAPKPAPQPREPRDRSNRD